MSKVVVLLGYLCLCLANSTPRSNYKFKPPNQTPKPQTPPPTDPYAPRIDLPHHHPVRVAVKLVPQLPLPPEFKRGGDSCVLQRSDNVAVVDVDRDQGHRRLGCVGWGLGVGV